MSDKITKKDIQGYLSLYLAVGFVLVALKIISPPITKTFFIGLFFMVTAAGGFYLLDLAPKPDHPNPIVRLLQTITRGLLGIEAPAPQPKNQDEQKREAGIKRLREEASYKVHTTAGVKLYTLEAWQEWRKAERHRVLFDNGLSPEEMEDRLQAIDDEYYMGIKNPRTDSYIFEEP